MPLPALVAGLLPALPSIFGAAGNIFGQTRAARQSNKNVQSQIKANRELAEYAHSKDLEMWERSNTYNAPTMQMERLKQAGLNPNLVYGSGATATSSATLPKYQTVKADYSQRRDPLASLSMLSTFQDLQLKQAQIDNVKKQTEGQEIRNGISEFNRLMKEADTNFWLKDRTWYTPRYGKLGMKETDGNRLQGRRWFYWEQQLDALNTQNFLRMKSIDDKVQQQELRQLDLDAWKNLERIWGKELQFGLPFLKLLMGIGR